MKPINVIQYPSNYSEFEIQASLYMLLKAQGVNVRGCVKATCDDIDKRKHRVYFDLVVFKDFKPLAIIECKNHKRKRNLALGTRQVRRYSKFGVPLIACYNMDYVEDSLIKIMKLWQGGVMRLGCLAPCVVPLPVLIFN